MANSPSHKFGQMIGNLLEEIVTPLLRDYCADRGLYLDTQGVRGKARRGKKVSWEDKYGNSHDLDFVIERGGTSDKRGRPVAFIEAAWRRYTKHSRNKAQEIQGAVLPVAEKYDWDQPFLGTVLAGVFTQGSLDQMESVGFEVLLFPYDSIVDAFRKVEINARFDESTPENDFRATIKQIENLPDNKMAKLKDGLVASNKTQLKEFLDSLGKKLDRVVDVVIVIPLHGNSIEFESVDDALVFVQNYDEDDGGGSFEKYEVVVRFSNGDKIDAIFSDKSGVRGFLAYVSGP